MNVQNADFAFALLASSALSLAAEKISMEDSDLELKITH